MVCGIRVLIVICQHTINSPQPVATHWTVRQLSGASLDFRVLMPYEVIPLSKLSGITLFNILHFVDATQNSLLQVIQQQGEYHVYGPIVRNLKYQIQDNNSYISALILFKQTETL